MGCGGREEVGVGGGLFVLLRFLFTFFVFWVEFQRYRGGGDGGGCCWGGGCGWREKMGGRRWRRRRREVKT
jgi:hypothetical protein